MVSHTELDGIRALYEIYHYDTVYIVGGWYKVSHTSRYVPSNGTYKTYKAG